MLSCPAFRTSEWHSRSPRCSLGALSEAGDAAGAGAGVHHPAQVGHGLCQHLPLEAGRGQAQAGQHQVVQQAAPVHAYKMLVRSPPGQWRVIL